MGDLAAALPHLPERLDDDVVVCVRLPAEVMRQLEQACGSPLGEQLHCTSRSVIVRMTCADRSKALEVLSAQVDAGARHLAGGDARDVAVSEAMRAQASIEGAVRAEALRWTRPPPGGEAPRRWHQHGTQPLPVEQLDAWLSRCRTLLDGSGADIAARSGPGGDVVEVIVGRAAPGGCCSARQVPAVAAGRFAERCGSCGSEPRLEVWLQEPLEVRDRPEPMSSIVEVPWPAELVAETHRCHDQAVRDVARAGSTAADALAATVSETLAEPVEDRHPRIAAAVAAAREGPAGATPGTAAITVGDQPGTITVGYWGFDSSFAQRCQIGGVSETALSLAVLGRDTVFADGETPTGEQLRWRWRKAIGSHDVPEWLCDSLAAARVGLSGARTPSPTRTRGRLSR